MPHTRMRSTALPWQWAALALALLVAMVMATTWGSVDIAPRTVGQMAWHQWLKAWGMDAAAPPPWSAQHFQIVWMIRLPRVLMAALAGAALALVGVVMQAMVRNPIADPYLLGVSSGASVGAVSVLALGVGAWAGLWAINLAAFAGALVATLVVYRIGWTGQRLHMTRLVLGGVAVGYVLAGVTSLITLLSAQRDLASAVLNWTLGSLAGTQWNELPIPCAVLLASLVWLLGHARALNALMTGDETAGTLGVETHGLRRTLFVLLSLLTGTVVAVSGCIGFVGLVIPHVVRLCVGHDHRKLLVLAPVAGAVFLVLIDLVARTAFAPTELPVGVITALMGGPVFVWMLVRDAARGYTHAAR